MLQALSELYKSTESLQYHPESTIFPLVAYRWKDNTIDLKYYLQWFW